MSKMQSSASIRTYNHEVKEIIQSMVDGRLSLFVGSAISAFPPTNIPTGKSIRDSMIRLLKQQDIKKKYQKKGYYRAKFLNSMSFEGILEICDYKDKVYSFMKELFNHVNPNPIHTFISELLLKKQCFSVITTNYDEGIEIAHSRIPKNKPLFPISKNTKLKEKNYPYFFKIHGSISDPPDQIINTLSQESRGLPQWKAESLNFLLKNRDVLFVGYSGYDFDICPFLLNIPIRKIFWCAKDNIKSSLSYEASAVLRKYDSRILKMDLRELFQLVSSGVDVPFSFPGHSSSHESTVERIFKDIFNDEERHVWFIIMLNIIGLGKDALAQCDYLQANKLVSRNNESRVKREKGVALFHIGRYRKASELFKEATEIAKTNRENPSFIVSLILDDAEAERCFGNLSRYIILLCEAYSYIYKDINKRAIRDQYKGLLYLRIGQLFESLISNFDVIDTQWIKKVLTASIRPTLEEAEKLFNADDNFFGKNHLKYRLGKIQEDPSQFKELAKECTRLGYIVGRVNSLRELSKIELKADHLDSASKYIRKSINLARRVYDLPGLAKGFEILGNTRLGQNDLAGAKKAFAKSWNYYSMIEVEGVIKDFFYERTRAKIDLL